MKKFLSSLLVCVMLISLMSGIIGSAADYSGVSEWAVAEVEKAEAQGLVPDCLKGQDLTESITRAEFAAVSVKAYEVMSGTKAVALVGNRFTDTNDAEVLKAYSVGITTGVSETEFEPNQLLDREQAATMLTRVVKKVSLDGWTIKTDGQFTLPYTKSAAFADDADISDWAKDSVYYMAASNVIKGVGGNKFAPKAQATREEALLIVVRMVENIQMSTPAAASAAENLSGYEDPEKYAGKGWYSDRYDKVVDGYYYNKQGFEIEEADYNDMLAKRKSIYSKVITNGMSDFDKTKAIYDWLCESVVYNHECVDNAEAWKPVKYNYEHQTAWAALILGTSVCAGYADALQFLLNGLGIESRYISGTATNSGGVTGGHAWNIIELDGGYYQADATWDTGRVAIFSSGELVSRYEGGANYFLISDSAMSKSRTWDRNKYPKCPEDYPCERIEEKGFHEINGLPAKENQIYKDGGKDYTIFLGDYLSSRRLSDASGNKVKEIQDGETYQYLDKRRGTVYGTIVDGYFVENEGNTPHRPETGTPPATIDVAGMDYDAAVKVLNDLGMWENDHSVVHCYTVTYQLTLEEDQHNKVHGYSRSSYASKGILRVNYYPKDAMEKVIPSVAAVLDSYVGDNIDFKGFEYSSWTDLFYNGNDGERPLFPNGKEIKYNYSIKVLMPNGREVSRPNLSEEYNLKSYSVSFGLFGGMGSIELGTYVRIVLSDPIEKQDVEKEELKDEEKPEALTAENTKLTEEVLITELGQKEESR